MRYVFLMVLICAGSFAADPFPLWDRTAPLPVAAEIPLLEGVEFHAVKRYMPEVDGYEFLHGLSAVFHKGMLYASWAHNKGLENTQSEVTRGVMSPDKGKTWSPVYMMAEGTDTEAVSHGVFLSFKGKLWAFLARFAEREAVRMEAYSLNEQAGAWVSEGMVTEEVFWPMCAPERMADGNWIMAGFQPCDGNPAAVAISRGDDLLHWDVVSVPKPATMKMWGEATILVDGEEIVCIARYGEKALALASVSRDYGRSWTMMAESNLPMTTSKPYAGTLRTGERYLVCTTAAENGGRRCPLTIALSRPGENLFSRVYRIRDEKAPDGKVIPSGTLAYPYAIEHGDALYVLYSVGHKRGNINSAELAVIPLSALTGGVASTP